MVDCGLVWMTIPHRLYYTLTIQHVQLSLIVHVTWARHSSCLAQLDCSGHMNSTLQHAQLSSTFHHAQFFPPACSALPSSMLSSALLFSMLSSTLPIFIYDLRLQWCIKCLRLLDIVYMNSLNVIYVVIIFLIYKYYKYINHKY